MDAHYGNIFFKLFVSLRDFLLLELEKSKEQIFRNSIKRYTRKTSERVFYQPLLLFNGRY